MTCSQPLRATLARLLTPAMLLALAGAGHCTDAVLPPAAALAQAPQAAAPPEPEGWVHAYAAYGTPRYGPAFTHFDFVDPQAPRGGTLFLANPDRRSNFDKFNPYTLKGNAPAGVSLLMIESLAVVGADEPLAMYGLLAERIRVAPDRSTVSFRLHAAARFSNGDPVLAEDVKYSFESLSGPYAAPSTQTALSGVARATVLDDRTIRFDLKDRTVDTVFAIGGLPVFSRKWAPGPDGKPRRFDEIVNEVPIGSGPYTIDLTDSGRRIEFKRNAQYWAGDQPVRRGYYNFDRIVYRYYADEDVRTEAFKAGEFDLIRVYSARKWARQFGGPKWNDGRIVKVMFEKGTGQGLQSIQLNLRRPIFQDIRVRQALILTYDFERLVNKYRQYHRTSSIFSNSEFAAVGLPSAGELALLEPYRATLPPEVFGPPYQSPNEQGDPGELRGNLLRARALLEAAGWQIAADGRLRNAAGAAFEIEYLNTSQGVEAQVIWSRTLEKLGIRLKIRTVDYALFRQRLENYDFDMVEIAGGEFTVPSAIDELSTYGSKSADEPGNNNLRGIKLAAVDHVLAAMAAAQTLPQMRDACRALDRIVMWIQAQVPVLWFAAERINYWNRFGMPAKLPQHFTADSPSSEFPAWPVVTWWIKPVPAQ